AILALDRTIVDWSQDTLQTDDPDRARAVLHSLVHRLGEAASAGPPGPEEAPAPPPPRAPPPPPRAPAGRARAPPRPPSATPPRRRHRAPRHTRWHDLEPPRLSGVRPGAAPRGAASDRLWPRRYARK